MQCACVLFSSLACLAVPDFSTLSHKRHAFRKKKVIKNITCVLILSTTSVSIISHSKKK